MGEIKVLSNRRRRHELSSVNISKAIYQGLKTYDLIKKYKKEIIKNKWPHAIKLKNDS